MWLLIFLIKIDLQELTCVHRFAGIKIGNFSNKHSMWLETNHKSLEQWWHDACPLGLHNHLHLIIYNMGMGGIYMD